jgi:phage terminase Nu1 subunit (DNA packaging protein)
MTLTKPQVLAIFGISARTLTRYQGFGLPVLKNSQPNQPNLYDGQAVHKWLVGRAISADRRATGYDKSGIDEAESYRLNALLEEELRKARDDE